MHDPYIVHDTPLTYTKCKLIRVKIGPKMRAPQGSPPKIFAPPGPLNGVPPQFRTVIKKLGEKSGGAPRGLRRREASRGRSPSSPRRRRPRGAPPDFSPNFSRPKAWRRKKEGKEKEEGKKKGEGKKGKEKGAGGGSFWRKFRGTPII